MKTWRWFILGWLLMAARWCGAESESNFVAKLEPVAPFASLQAAGKARGIPVQGFDSPTNESTLTSGDSVTTLVTLHEKGGHITQWLVYFQVGDKPKPAKEPDPLVIYTSTGYRFEFAGAQTSIRVRTLGPFVDTNSGRRTPAFEDKNAEASVNNELLMLGLNPGVAAIYRCKHFGNEEDANELHNSYESGSKPYDSARVEHDRKLAAKLNVTTNEERSVVGMVPALFSYFDTVGEIPGLKGILLKVVSKPSVWSVVRNLGVNAFIRFDRDRIRPLSPTGWDLPVDSTNYTFPLFITLNGHRALDVSFITAPARPPLLPCGGIVGFLAENPDDQENYLTLRVISARCKSGLPEVAR